MQGLAVSRKAFSTASFKSRRMVVAAHARPNKQAWLPNSPSAVFAAAAATAVLAFSPPALAERIGEFTGSGFLFKASW